MIMILCSDRAVLFNGWIAMLMIYRVGLQGRSWAYA